MTAGLGKAITGNMARAGRFAGVVRAAVVGGTISVLGGGKFSNGAQTGAFQYLFNQLISEGKAERQAELRRQAAALATMTPEQYLRGWSIMACGEPVCTPGTVTGQVAYGPGMTGMLGIIGVSTEVSDARGSDGSRCVQHQTCFLVGAGLGYSVDANASIGTGSPGDSWQLALFGKLATPFAGGEIAPWIGSDGFGLQAGFSVGEFLGGGVKFCTAQCVAGDWKDLYGNIKNTNKGGGGK